MNITAESEGVLLLQKENKTTDKQADEVFMVSLTKEKESEYGEISWRTKRKGDVAPDGSFPVFVKRSEVEKKKLQDIPFFKARL